jgi:2-oxoglutarate ferredoxin oxidoreductase subunit alpha
MHRIGGLEKDYFTGVISSNPENHQLMVDTRKAKIKKIADFIPEQAVIGNKDADTLIVGWGGTYGHLLEVMMRIQDKDRKVALAHFRFINPLPRNTYDILKKYKTIIVAEQNTGHFASYLLSQFDDIKVHRFNRVEGQPFSVSELVDEFIKIMGDN